MWVGLIKALCGELMSLLSFGLSLGRVSGAFIVLYIQIIVTIFSFYSKFIIVG